MRKRSPERRSRRIGPVVALLIASGVALLSAWLLWLPAGRLPRASAALRRPELLDKPHRHQVASAPSAASTVR
jgi:hypothetical protein